MRRILALLPLVALGAAACTGTSFRDYEGGEVRDPNSVAAFTNVDGYPNVVKICIDDVAFATTTRPDFGSIMRVPEWDDDCEGLPPGPVVQEAD